MLQCWLSGSGRVRDFWSFYSLDLKLFSVHPYESENYRFKFMSWEVYVPVPIISTGARHRPAAAQTSRLRLQPLELERKEKKNRYQNANKGLVSPSNQTKRINGTGTYCGRNLFCFTTLYGLSQSRSRPYSRRSPRKKEQEQPKREGSAVGWSVLTCKGFWVWGYRFIKQQLTIDFNFYKRERIVPSFRHVF